MEVVQLYLLSDELDARGEFQELRKRSVSALSRFGAEDESTELLC